MGKIRVNVINNFLSLTNKLLLNAYRMAHFISLCKIKRRLIKINLEGKYIIAIDIPFGFLYQHIKEIYERLSAHPQIKVVFIVPLRNPSDPKGYLLKNNICEDDIIPYPFIHNNKELRVFFTPANSKYISLHPSTIKVMHAHGLAGWGNGKSILGIENILNYDYLFTTGTTQEKVLDSYFEQDKYSDKPIRIPVGYAISDRLFLESKKFDKTQYLKNVGLNPEKVTVIYAPSWGDTSSSVSSGIEIIEKLCSSRGKNILVKLHPALLYGISRKSEYSVTGNINWKKELSELQQKYSCFYHVENDNDFSYLFAADIMITDISGIGFEFLLLGKQVIYIDVPEYFKRFGKDGPEYWARTGIIIKRIQDIDSAIKRCVQNLTICDEDRNEIRSKLIHNPGKASEIAVKEIVNILGL